MILLKSRVKEHVRREKGGALTMVKEHEDNRPTPPEICSNAIEYVTRDLFKGKSLKAAANSFVKKFSGQENAFVGEVKFSANELVEAVVRDKAKTAIASAERLKPGMGHIALEATAQRFNIPIEALASAVARELGGGDGNGILKEQRSLVKALAATYVRLIGRR